MTENGKPKFFYGHTVVAAAFIIQLVGWGVFNTFGIFFVPLLTEFGWLRATISGAQSLSFLLHGLMSIVVGSLSDRFGPRLVMTTCGFLLGLGYLLLSLVNTIWQLYLFYVVIGIGVSAVDVVLLSTVARWFIKNRGMMSGLVKVGTGAGMLVMPLIAGGLIATYGWRSSYIIVGAVSLVVIVSIARLLRRDPGEMQQLPDGRGAGTVNIDSVGQGLSLREAIHTRQSWTVCVVYLTIVFCANTIVMHIAPHAEDVGISAIGAASILSIIGGASIVGRFIMGSAGDRIGNKLAMTVCFVILLVSLLWLHLANEFWRLCLFAAIYGFAHGGFFALISPTVAGLFGTGSHGVILGIVIFSGTIGGAVGTVLAGHIFDITHSYEIIFLVLAALGLIGLVLTVSLRPIRGKGGANDS